MKRIIVLIITLALSSTAAPIIFAAEHGGAEHKHEHGGVEHAGKKASEPTTKEIQQAMNDYIIQQSKQTGTFDIFDPEVGRKRKLSLVRIHERVGKTGNYYYSCADFKDAESAELLDLDVDVENIDGKLSVVEVRVHKVNGKARYTYDEHDQRIPVTESK